MYIYITLGGQTYMYICPCIRNKMKTHTTQFNMYSNPPPRHETSRYTCMPFQSSYYVQSHLPLEHTMSLKALNITD